MNDIINIVLDEDGFYTGSYCEIGSIDNSVKVSRPAFFDNPDIFKQMSYKYYPAQGVWAFDNIRYQYLLRQDEENNEESLIEKNKKLEAKLKEMEVKIDKILSAVSQS